MCVGDENFFIWTNIPLERPNSSEIDRTVFLMRIYRT